MYGQWQDWVHFSVMVLIHNPVCDLD